MKTTAMIFLCLLAAGCAHGTTPSRGRLTKTDRSLDLAIEGDGYFVFASSATAFVFSRNGQLYMDADGWLTNEDGYRLVPTRAVPPGATEVHVERDGRVMARSDAGGEPQHVADIPLAKFANPDALARDGIYLTPTACSGDPVTGVPGTAGFGALVAGTLEQ